MVLPCPDYNDPGSPVSTFAHSFEGDLPSSNSDFERIAALIGDARVVGLGEVRHLTREPLEFRNRLTTFLTERLGFTVVALESGLAESNALFDNIVGDAALAEEKVEQGFTWEFGKIPQNRALVRRLKVGNQSRGPQDTVRLYGFDLPGSPGNPDFARWFDAPLAIVLAFFDRYAPRAVTEARVRLGLFADALRYASPGDRPAILLQREIDGTTAAIVDLIACLDRSQRHLVSRSSPDAFRWARAAAMNALQLDTWLRIAPAEMFGHLAEADALEEKAWHANFDWTAAERDAVRDAFDARDRAQADNVRWILEQNPRARVLLFAASAHLSAAPISYRIGGKPVTLEPAGTYLREWLGADLVILATSGGGGVMGLAPDWLAIPQPTADSFDGLIGAGATKPFIVDLRTLPESTRRTLDRELPLAHVPEFSLNPVEAFDAVLHFPQLSAAG